MWQGSHGAIAADAVLFGTVFASRTFMIVMLLQLQSQGILR
jgi:hypothetical protein